MHVEALVIGNSITAAIVEQQISIERWQLAERRDGRRLGVTPWASRRKGAADNHGCRQLRERASFRCGRVSKFCHLDGAMFILRHVAPAFSNPKLKLRRLGDGVKPRSA